MTDNNDPRWIDDFVERVRKEAENSTRNPKLVYDKDRFPDLGDRTHGDPDTKATIDEVAALTTRLDAVEEKIAIDLRRVRSILWKAAALPTDKGISAELWAYMRDELNDAIVTIDNWLLKV